MANLVFKPQVFIIVEIYVGQFNSTVSFEQMFFFDFSTFYNCTVIYVDCLE